MENKVKVTAVVLTKNEALQIRECLDGLKWADEILVIDDYSQDTTVKLARQKGARVLKHHLKNFADQRNLALHRANYPWVFFVDADERVTPTLAKEIVRRIEKRGGEKGYRFHRQDIFWGHALHFGENARNTFIRLGRKNAGCWQGFVHERWAIKGKVGNVQEPLYHRLPSLRSFLEKINFYTSLRARELKRQNKAVNSLSVVVYPLAKFCCDYCFWQGFRDGTPGLIIAMLMTFHSFLVRAKLWHLYHHD